MKFKLCFPTPYLFMRLFHHATNSEIQIEPICLFFIELCLFEFEMVERLPSMLAVSAIYTAQCTMHQYADAERLANLSTVTGYSSFGIEDLARIMVTLHQKVGSLSQSHEMLPPNVKYIKANQLGVCREKPAVFLLH